MAKMYRIKDDDGKEYEVKEVEETVQDDDIEEVAVEETPEAPVEQVAPLTDEEITALRALLAERNAEAMEDDDEELEEDETLEEENLEEEEEVVDTAKPCDSKKKGIKDSANSNEVKIEDSIDDIDDREAEIAQQWAKRFK